MLIRNITVANFRLLKSLSIDLENDLSLLVGKNNTGKTSLLYVLQSFYNSSGTFSFNDFSIPTGEKLKKINDSTEVADLEIMLDLTITYNEQDDLSKLSEFIIDLSPSENKVNIIFKSEIDKKKLLEDLSDVEEDDVGEYIEKNISKYLKNRIYTYTEEDKKKIFVKKEIRDFRKLVNFQIIHAKRNVASSDSSHGSKKVLSTLTTNYFNKKNQDNPKDFSKVNKMLKGLDSSLSATYDDFFDGFLSNAAEILENNTIKVVSNLESSELIENSSKVVYGDTASTVLPEHLNGLGYMNILYLLLMIEIKKDLFNDKDASINLLFIEEPEAHTHPQMQYVFSEKIAKILKGVNNLQTLITTHSSHIVKKSNFKNIKYIKRHEKDKCGFEYAEVKNFHEELKKKYSDINEFKFIEQYLSLQAAELFFSSKVILIEGVSESIMLPHFMDVVELGDSVERLNLQNLSVLEVGANAKAFHVFLDFLEIKTLVITDLDTVKKEKITKKVKGKAVESVSYKACQTTEAFYTSNSSIRHFYKLPNIENGEVDDELFKKLLKGELETVSDYLNVTFQTEENKYRGRSFEDAFINVNLHLLIEHKDDILGINPNVLDQINDENLYEMTDKLITKKSDFASSLLFIALTKEISWVVPEYIASGLKWIGQ